MSPQYPGYYTNNARYQWLLKVPKGHVIRLEFLYFDLENHPRCSNDFVEVRYSLSLLSYKFCGQTLPSAIESSGKSMWISFESNERTMGGGFEARFRAVKGM